MTLIVGYGNTLRGDDGAGAAVAEALRHRVPDAEIITSQALTPELAERVTHHAHVLFIDARAGDRPGRVSTTAITAGAVDPALQGHGLSPGGIVALAAQLFDWRGTAWLVSIEASAFDYGTALSPVVAAGVHTAATRVSELLAAGAADR